MEFFDTKSVERFLKPYLPSIPSPSPTNGGVFVTATWAQSLDARIAAAPGQRTQLSGLYTKKMTHFLRTQYDGILVGKNTVLADNPSLNARFAPNCPSPRPIVLDSQFELGKNVDEFQVWQNARSGAFLAPWIVVDCEVCADDLERLRVGGGDVIRVNSTRSWPEICAALAQRGVKSLMVEGGAQVLASCLASGVVSSVVVTCAPVFLGQNGVLVAPLAELRPREVAWWTDVEVPDAVYAAKLEFSEHMHEK